jgi:hypothetical protein
MFRFLVNLSRNRNECCTFITREYTVATVSNNEHKQFVFSVGAVHMMLIEPVLVVWDVLKMTLAISS